MQFKNGVLIIFDDEAQAMQSAQKFFSHASKMLVPQELLSEGYKSKTASFLVGIVDLQVEMSDKEFPTCGICYCPCGGEGSVGIDCKHVFCYNCMRQYCKTKAEELVLEVKCPHPICSLKLSNELLQQLLGLEVYNRWRQFLNQEKVDPNSYCPQCNNLNLEVCTKCFRCELEYCSHCRLFHIGELCIPPDERLSWLQNRQMSSDITVDQKKVEENMINELLSIAEAFRDGTRCPTCLHVITRIDGYNKVLCPICQEYFCYQCGKKIKAMITFRLVGVAFILQ